MTQNATRDRNQQTRRAPRELHADVVVIGWGKGGKTFAGAMAAAGRRVVMIEQDATMYGGTCINIGCVPTKALVHDAQRRHDHAAGGQSAREFFASAVIRRDALITALNDVNFHMLADRDTLTVVDGRARFVGPHELEVEPSVGGRGLAERLRVHGEVIVINTGAVPALPPIPGADGPRVFDSTGIQHVDPLPQRLAVVGAGPIGLEFASMFAGFGSRVSLLAGSAELLPHEEPEVRAELARVLTDDGVSLRLGSRVTALEPSGDTVTIRVHRDDAASSPSASAAATDRGAGAEGLGQEHASDTETLEVDAVLLATGRRPATDGLGLEHAGITTDERGAVVVDDHLRTSVPGVYAMGDVHGGRQQTYLSLDDHRIVLDQLVGEGTRAVSDRRAVPATTFVTPPLSSVGLTEAEAREAGHNVRTVVAKVAGVKAMPRPKTLGDARGVIKIVVDAADDRILGARLFHVDSQEVINLVALAMRAGVTASELRDGIWTHPSSTEALNEVLGQLS